MAEEIHRDNAIETTAPSSCHRKMVSSRSHPLVRDAPYLKEAPHRNHSFDDDEYLLHHTVPHHQRFYQHSSSLPEPLPAPAPREPSGPLPEFTGRGGDAGIFRAPLRGAVHPGRPPALELRPRPLRETQAGSFLRTIAGGVPSQLWAGLECGVRFWDLMEVFSGRRDEEEEGRRPPRGDEDSAPFRESCRTPPTMCLAADAGNRMMWSGHKDGKIRAWKMDQPPLRERGEAAAGAARFKEVLSWQAHHGPVISMVFSSTGDLWSGTEGGIIKVWPWEIIEKALCLKLEEMHMSAFMIEGSFLDLRSQVMVNGACSLPCTDVKFLLSDNSRSRIWSGCPQFFALWNSRSKVLLKVFNIDGHAENKVDFAPGLDSFVDNEKTKFMCTSKREKLHGSRSFFQRSRNALLGAADALRRVASKGATGDENRRTEAMAISVNGVIWTGCANGMLIQWDGNGNRLQEFHRLSSSVHCLCAYGTRLWVGYMNGHIQIVDLEGNLLGGWVAHNSPVIDMAIGADYIFTLANHGGIRGWNLSSPGVIDDILQSELTDKELLFTKLETFRLLVGTWNVGQERASHDSLISWIGYAAFEADIVVVGLQEIEMGAGFLAIAAAKESVGLEGSANGHWWLDTLGKTLDEGIIFERVGSRQLAGLLISVWARKKIRKYIGDIDAAAVACGFGHAIGNKTKRLLLSSYR